MNKLRRFAGLLTVLIVVGTTIIESAILTGFAKAFLVSAIVWLLVLVAVTTAVKHHSPRRPARSLLAKCSFV